MTTLDTPEERVAAFIRALRAADADRIRTTLEPIGLAGIPTPDGDYLELLPADVEALLAKALQHGKARREAQEWYDAATASMQEDPGAVRVATAMGVVLQAFDDSPGVLCSSDDLPEEPPLFTTRQLFKQLEGRVERLERAAFPAAGSGAADA